jgi:hypothetical protein
MSRVFRLISTVSVVLIAVIVVQVWIPRYGLSNVGLHLRVLNPLAQEDPQNLSLVNANALLVDNGEPMLKLETEEYGPDSSRYSIVLDH